MYSIISKNPYAFTSTSTSLHAYIEITPLHSYTITQNIIIIMFTKEDKIEDVLAKFPDSVKIFIGFRLPCLTCGEPYWGSIEELARRYKVDADKIVKVLNEKHKEVNK
ncbi:MAG: hypothetical protein A2Y62_17410 [Candidatus Fischerbacteria bacterium RBG_13_37_8]|uniref:DUF1858 domain-containing protein n=1 Tax=Candidatus Fischerbacteria bacterium RBG_13_37_8 TaxID=1817863 RepID=A0A1F5VN52_9BACT|nr:MAG: hypothetical protein A2Y62_17410 [Candidatus Fischerbacteria bacterium RBG_13_37_8]